MNAIPVMNGKHKFVYRVAIKDDVPAIRELMGLSIAHNMRSFLSDEEIDAAKETMGVDMTLINDGTYFVIYSNRNACSTLVGCGGWGKRKTLYGGDHTKGRNDELSDPRVDAARIRAMYTHPDWVRCGIGSILLKLGETAAKQAGFSSIELGSTVPGEPLYTARFYKEISRYSEIAANGSESVIIKMMKTI
jgi:GNAT superfamily N-acetyltransferase